MAIKYWLARIVFLHFSRIKLQVGYSNLLSCYGTDLTPNKGALDLKMFRLHEKLDEDCLLVGQFDLSLLLISRDANYPWLILVPKREEITEIFQLEPQDRQQLLEESCILSQAMTELFAPDKLNIAALGNVVPQLHVHHIARYHSDPAWPKPIWGVVPADNYDPDMLSARCENLRQRLKNRGFR